MMRKIRISNRVIIPGNSRVSPVRRGNSHRTTIRNNLILINPIPVSREDSRYSNRRTVIRSSLIPISLIRDNRGISRHAAIRRLRGLSTSSVRCRKAVRQKASKNRSTAVYLSLVIALLIIGLVVGAVFLLNICRRTRKQL